MEDTEPFLAICKVLTGNTDGTPGDQKADFEEIMKSLGTFSSVCRPEYNPYDTKERQGNGYMQEEKQKFHLYEIAGFKKTQEDLESREREKKETCCRIANWGLERSQSFVLFLPQGQDKSEGLHYKNQRNSAERSQRCLKVE